MFRLNNNQMEKKKKTEIPLFKYKQLLTLLFANDQVIIPNTEDNLQKAAKNKIK
jgi:hypothetical protein